MSAAVPETMAMVVVEIDSVEVYQAGHDKQDAGVVTMTAAIDAVFAHGWTDAAEIYSEAQITGGNTRDLFDAATVSVVAVISAAPEGKEYVDAAVAQVVAVPVTVENFTAVDAAEAIVVADSSSVNTKDSVDAGTVSSVGLISSAPDTLYHNYVDAATVDVLGLVSAASEFQAHDYTDSDTAQVIAADGGSSDAVVVSDAATVVVVGLASALESLGYNDVGEAVEVGVPSAVDTADYVDAATVTLTSITGGGDIYGHVDTATVDVIGVPSGVDLVLQGDNATVDVIGVVSGVEVYTQPPAHANETYIYFWGSSGDGGGDQGSGGDPGGSTSWNKNVSNASRYAMGVSTAEVSHTISDLPVRYQDYQFFASAPANQYGYFFALGDAGSVGVRTTGVRSNPPTALGTSASATTSGYTLPDQPSTGDIILVYVMARGQTASTPTDTSGRAYTLVFSGSSAGGVNHYLWRRTPIAGEGDLVVTSALSGSCEWAIGTMVLSTPSSTVLYKLDEQAFVDHGGNPRHTTLTATTHG